MMNERGRLGCQIIAGGVVIVLLLALMGGGSLWMQTDPQGAAAGILGDTGDTALEIVNLWGGMLRCAVPLGVVVAVVMFFAGSKSG